MRYFNRFLFIVLFWVSVANGFGETIRPVSSVKATLLIDSLESVLPTAPAAAKAGLYDTLASLTGLLSKDRSLEYYLKLHQLPDSLVSFEQKVKATRNIVSIYLDMNKIDKANFYIEAYGKALERYPQETGMELINTIYNKDADAVKNHFSFTNKDVLILLILLILGAVFYLSYLYRKFKSIEKKKTLLLREAEIIRAKNRETGEELEKVIQSKTSVEEAEIEKIRKEQLRLKKELKKLEESFYNRNAFLNGLGPELRTALSSILGFSAELKSEIEKLNNPELKANSVDLFAKNLQLDVMLENMVDMSGAQINLLNIDLKPYSVTEIIDKVTASLQYLTENKKGQLKVKIANDIPDVKADKEKLIRIINDIVINVYKQSSTKTVMVSAGANKLQSEVFLVVSESSGALLRAGIDKSKVDVQDDLPENNHGSFRLYLELFASRELIAAMGGTMQISMMGSEETVAVTVNLPAVKASLSASEKGHKVSIQQEQGPALLADVDIFLVEDDRMNRMVIETMLKDAGKVTTAVDGEETLQIIEKYHREGKVFDIMLFDINLPPPWDGIALMHRIKKDFPEFEKVPFVAQTAYAMASDRERFLNEGFDDYLTKPINKGELLTIIHHQLELFKEQDR